MNKLKRTGTILVICLLAAQITGITAASIGSGAPDAPAGDTPPALNRAMGEDLLPPDGYESLPDELLYAPYAAHAGTDAEDTTEEIEIGGYHSGQTLADDDPAEPLSTASEAFDSVPATKPSETTVPDTTVPETTVPETTVPETTVPQTTVPETTVPEATAPKTDVPETEAPETGNTVVPPAAPSADEGQGGLYTIANPSPNYGYRVVSVTGSERDLLERLVMGEAGDQGYIGAAMVAQCIKDAMTYEGYTSVEAVRRGMKYSGSIRRTPNANVKKAVAYIFDEGGYAVQHPILYFYYCGSGIKKNSFHETQEFVVQYKDHRFFWKR